MLKRMTRIAAIALTATVLGAGMSQTRASGQLPILKECLARAEKAPDPRAARDQCMWQHWDLMAEYGM